MDGQYWKGHRTMSTNEWLLTSDFWQFLQPWHGRWYEYEIFIASCTNNICDLENDRWLLGDMIDHVGIYGSRVIEGLSAFDVGLVHVTLMGPQSINLMFPFRCKQNMFQFVTKSFVFHFIVKYQSTFWCSITYDLQIVNAELWLLHHDNFVQIQFIGKK